jgi:hypothetical protein
MKGNRVDHPRKKSKDLADALTGAVFGALSHTPKNTNIEIDVHTWGSSRPQVAPSQGSMIELDSKKVPDDVRDYLARFDLI